MQNKIVLISDDSDFFEYIIPKLKLRKSDELFSFKFGDLPDKIHMLSSSLLIINSACNPEQTLQLLDLVNDIPVIVFGFNNDDEFLIETYKRGALAYFTPDVSDAEIEAKLLPFLNLVSSIKKSALYREMLVQNKIIAKNNEVFLDFTNILEREIDQIKKNSATATLVAISADENSKFIIQPNQLETIILNNIRKNDILMAYAFNKYFLLFNNTGIDKAKEIWSIIKKKLPEGVYSGFAAVGNKNRQQVVNEVLNDLHKSMSKVNFSGDFSKNSNVGNFKNFRKEFDKKIMQVVSPSFYHIQQAYNDKLFGIKIEQGSGDGYGVLYLKTDDYTACFRITSPGFSTINIDISYDSADNDNIHKLNLEQKHITIEPEELEQGLLDDLLEEFIQEFKIAVSAQFSEERG